MRGEYFGLGFHCGTFLELPPRARRIHVSGYGMLDKEGTTSACAENTIPGVEVGC